MTSVFHRKIPTGLGLLLLAVAVFATSYLVNTGVILFGKASPTDNPEEVRITNISDSTFTITYKTEAKVIGTLSLNDSGKTQTVLDERDQESGTPQPYTLHSISFKTAKESTTYTFSILSGSTIYENNGNPFSVKTGPAISASPSAVTPFTGKLLDENGNPAVGALVFVTTSGGQSLSSLTNGQGIYILPLNAIRTSDLTSPLALDNNPIMQILATDGTAQSQAQILLANANPVPIMTLSNNYNFTLGTTPVASTSGSLGFPPFPESNDLTATPVIITPKKDEGFTDSQPQFSGKALPNQTVTIQIHSDTVVSTTVQTDSLGNWTYRPSTPLSPGQHVLSITTKNAAGILTTIQQSFTVYASGSQVTQSATPSGQLSPSPTESPTSFPTATPTIAPTSAVTTPVITNAITPKPTLPPTGNDSLIVTSFLGVATTIVGIVLFTLTKGAAL